MEGLRTVWAGGGEALTRIKRGLFGVGRSGLAPDRVI